MDIGEHDKAAAGHRNSAAMLQQKEQKIRQQLEFSYKISKLNQIKTNGSQIPTTATSDLLQRRTPKDCDFINNACTLNCLGTSLG